MKANSDRRRTFLVVVLLVVALALATWSAVRTFGPKGRVIGDLGNLSRDSEVGKSVEMKGGDAASGAPPEAAASEEGGGR